MRQTPPPVVDIVAVIPEFGPYARTTVRLHPRRGPASAAQSKIGGPILWPKHEPWPLCTIHQSPYVAVLQLRAEDVPELGFPADKDLFQLLWCPNDHQSSLFDPLPEVYWRRAADIGARLIFPPPPMLADKFSIDYLPIPCVLHPERVTEFPDAFELEDYGELEQKVNTSPQLQEASKAYEFDEPIDLYQNWLSVAAGTKVGGYPDWIQSPEWPVCACGVRMEFLLTVASAEFNGGTTGRWLATEEEDVWERDYEEREAVQCAADIEMGDMGNLYLFICRKCPHWSVSAVFQCS